MHMESVKHMIFLDIGLLSPTGWEGIPGRLERFSLTGMRDGAWCGSESRPQFYELHLYLSV